MINLIIALVGMVSTGIPVDVTCIQNCKKYTQSVAVLRWGQGAEAPQILPRPPKFLDTVVLLLVELIGSIVNFA